MYYVTMKDGVAVSATTNYNDLDRSAQYEHRNDWKTMDRVVEIAAQLSTATGNLWIATDAGAHTSPRYDVVPAPTVGELASYAFNGDCTPCGKIASVSKTLKVVKTDDGSTFYRKGLSGTWKMHGTWSLVSGHHSKRNPSL